MTCVFALIFYRLPKVLCRWCSRRGSPRLWQQIPWRAKICTLLSIKYKKNRDDYQNSHLLSVFDQHLLLCCLLPKHRQASLFSAISNFSLLISLQHRHILLSHFAKKGHLGCHPLSSGRTTQFQTQAPHPSFPGFITESYFSTFLVTNKLT